MNTLKKYSLIAFLALSFSAMAQPAPPGSGNPAPLPGLVWLAAAGAAYGAKKVYDKKKEAE
jgi:hypothetical protein